LNRTLAKVKATHAVADEITLELHKQLEKLEKTSVAINDTRTNVKKANEYISYFAKQLMTDKIIMGLVILCVIAIIAILVLRVKGTETGGGGGLRPPKYDVLHQ